jgi:hypothetical protein
LITTIKITPVIVFIYLVIITSINVILVIMGVNCVKLFFPTLRGFILIVIIYYIIIHFRWQRLTRSIINKIDLIIK